MWCHSNIPTRQRISQRMIPDRFETTKAALKSQLETAPSLTTDMWTSSSNNCYMCVTAHWVDNEFTVHTKCLAVRPAPGSHTADFISKEITDICTQWSLDVRVLHVITDSGANVKKAMSQLPTDKWRPCFVHTLQLVVNGALASKEVSDLPKIITKARAIVSHFTHFYPDWQSPGSALVITQQASTRLPDLLELTGWTSAVVQFIYVQ